MGKRDDLQQDVAARVRHDPAAAGEAARRAGEWIQHLDERVSEAEADSLERYEARRDRIARDIEPPSSDDSPEPA
jgi:hypothetical protein